MESEEWSSTALLLDEWEIRLEEEGIVVCSNESILRCESSNERAEFFS